MFVHSPISLSCYSSRSRGLKRGLRIRAKIRSNVVGALAPSLTGQIAYLAAALMWAAAVMVFRSSIASHGARTINLAKGLIASLLLALTAAALGSWNTLAAAPSIDIGLLAFSGLVGITLGDTALFAAVVRIGVHRSLLLQTLAPVFTALIAIPLGERLSSLQTLGGLVILGGVALVVAQRPMANGNPLPRSDGTARGLAFGVLGAFGQGAGVVIAKAGMTVVPALPATLVRVAAATAGLLVLAAARRNLGALAAAFRDRAMLRQVVPATFLGTYIAMLLMMAGIALAPASIAAVLLATSPVFSLILESVLERRLPSAVGVLGTLLAVAGVGLLSATV